MRSISDLVAHARHIAETVGPEHLALGTDMNGVPGVMAGFGGETDLPKLTAALLDGGFDDREVKGILGDNALRVLGRVEAEARRDPVLTGHAGARTVSRRSGVCSGMVARRLGATNRDRTGPTQFRLMDANHERTGSARMVT